MSSATQRHINRIRERLLSTEMVTAGEITFTRYEFNLAAVLDFEPQLANLLDTWEQQPRATARQLLESYQQRNAYTRNLFQRFQVVNVASGNPQHFTLEYVGKDVITYGQVLENRRLIEVMPEPIFWKAAADYWRAAICGEAQYSVVTHTGYGVFRSYGRLVLPLRPETGEKVPGSVLIAISYIEQPPVAEADEKIAAVSQPRRDQPQMSAALAAVNEANRDYGRATDWLGVLDERMQRVARMVEIAKELRRSAAQTEGTAREKLLLDAAELERRAAAN
jgi:hypothetical protein